MPTFRSEVESQGFELDYTNPIASKIKHFICVKDGVIQDVIGGLSLTVGASVSVSGNVMDFSTTDGRILSNLGYIPNAVTVMGRANYDNSTQDHSLVGFESNDFQFWVDTNSNQLRTASFAGVSEYGANNGVPINEWVNLGFTFDNTTDLSSHFFNGVKTVADVNIGTRGWNSGDVCFGGVVVGTGKNSDAQYEYFLVADSVLTDAEIISLQADPYQLFRTSEDVVRDYGLTFDGLGNYLTFEATQEGSTSFDLEFEWTPTSLAESFDPLFSSDTSDSNTRHGVFQKSDNELEVSFIIGGARTVVNTTGAALSVGTRKNLRVSYDGSSLSVFIDGAPVGSVAASGTVSATGGGIDTIGKNSTNYGNFQLHFFRFTFGTDNRYYDCNVANNQQYVPELIQGKHGTMVGFPAPSGYVRELDSHGGVEFDGTQRAVAGSITLPATWRVDAYVTTGTLANDKAFFDFDSDSDGERIGLYTDAASNVLKIASNSKTPGSGTTVLQNGTTYKLSLEWDGAQFHCYIDDTPEYSVTPTDSGAFLSGAFTPYFADRADSTKDINATFTRVVMVGVHDWRFDQTTGTTVPDVVGGNDATLQNFTNVYYRPEASNALIGYQFNGETGNYPLLSTGVALTAGDTITFEINSAVLKGTSQYLLDGSGVRPFVYMPVNEWAWNINTISGMTIDGTPITRNATPEVDLFDGNPHIVVVTIAAATTVTRFFARFNGSETLQVNTKSVVIAGSVSHSYDFTTGDTDQIIDTVGGNHATIQSAPTSGFLPVIDKQVFTTSDYAALSNLQTSESAQSYIVDYYAGATAGNTLSGFANGLQIRNATITGAQTLTTSGDVYFYNSTMDNLTVTGATGNVYLEGCVADDVTN